MTLNGQYEQLEKLLECYQEIIINHFKKFVFPTCRSPSTEQLIQLDRALKEDRSIQLMLKKMAYVKSLQKLEFEMIRGTSELKGVPKGLL